MAIEWVVGVALVSAGLGFLVAYLRFKSALSAQQEAETLRAELQTSQQELQDYRQDVLGQFADTAEKFRALDNSYHELHRQLATSAAALIGDAANPLLTGPDQSQVSVADEALEIEAETSTVEDPPHAAATPPDETDETPVPVAADEAQAKPEQDSEEPSATVAVEATASAAEDLMSATPDESDDTSEAAPAELAKASVPTLTEVDAVETEDSERKLA